MINSDLENKKILLFMLGLTYMTNSILFENEYLFICSYIVLNSMENPSL
jgi:hypothetical protein